MGSGGQLSDLLACVSVCARVCVSLQANYVGRTRIWDEVLDGMHAQGWLLEDPLYVCLSLCEPLALGARMCTCQQLGRLR